MWYKSDDNLYFECCGKYYTEKSKRWKYIDVLPEKSMIINDLYMPNKCNITNSVYIVLTNECNLNCLYCYAYSNRKKDITDESAIKSLLGKLLMRVAYEKQKVFKVYFCGGGEPTIRIQSMINISNFVKKCCDLLGIDLHLYLITNAQWDNDEVTEWIANNIERTAVSLDGIGHYNNIQRCRSDGIDGYMVADKNISKLLSLNANVSIRSTVTSYNIDGIKGMVDYYSQKGVKLFHFEPSYPSNIRCPLNCSEDRFVNDYLLIKRENAGKLKIRCSLDVIDEQASLIRYCCGFQANKCLAILPDGTTCNCIEMQNSIKHNPIAKECLNCVVMPRCRGGCERKMLKAENGNGFSNPSQFLCRITKNLYYRQAKPSEIIKSLIVSSEEKVL